MSDPTAYVNSKLGQELVDPWGLYKGECVSLAQDWIQFNGWPMRTGNAIQFVGQSGNGWAWIANTPTGVAPAGSLVVFEIGQYGHIGIAMPGATENVVSLANQNWPGGKDQNPVCITEFNYLTPKCLGWLVYEGTVAPTRTVTVNTKGLNVRTGPHKTNSIVKTLSLGTVVPVLESIPGDNVNGNSAWYEIAPSDFISAYYTK